MFVSIRKYPTIAPQEVARRVNEGFLPLISSAQGFIAFYGVDSGDGDWMAVCIFETQEQAEQSNTAASEWVKANVAPLITGPPEIIGGQIVVAKGVA